MTLNERILFSPSLRWSGSLSLVFLLYLAIIMIAINWRAAPYLAYTPPMAAMAVELAMMPIAPSIAISDKKPTLIKKVIKQPEPEPEPIIEELPEIPVIEKAAATLSPKPKKKKIIKDTKPQKDVEPEQTEESTPTTNFDTPEESSVPAAPSQGALSMNSPNAAATWQTILLNHLEKYKRYPRQARRRGQEAVVRVSVKMNRDGSVIEHHLTRLCPYKSLNKETLALIRRAQPLPPPPIEIAGSMVEFVVPVAFSLR